ncbi:hypothetical protein ID866_5037 [Astraeus odoratus]|nr:hypothetical protein ID866_5037 [Astraeus odoratus]
MPATRTHSLRIPSSISPQRQSRTSSGRDPQVTTSCSKKPVKTPSSRSEVIVLSSDDDVLPVIHAGPPKRASRRQKKGSRPLPRAPREVLEISESDDGNPSPQLDKRKEDEDTADALQQKIANLEQALKLANKRSAQELAELRSLEKCHAEEIAVLRDTLRKKDVSELEDHILCEVCTHKMWKPYLLADCGHCFCQDCLVEWFTTTQVQFMSTHPNYDVHRAMVHNEIRGLLSSIPTLLNSHLQRQIQVFLNHLRNMQPEYVCPKCRKSVVTKPVEDFRVKSLVRQIAGLQGESSPRKEGHGVAIRGPFDAFFPTAFHHG